MVLLLPHLSHLKSFNIVQCSSSLFPLIDFLGKVEEHSVRKVLSVTRDEFLQALVALVFVLAVEAWHLQDVV